MITILPTLTGFSRYEAANSQPMVAYRNLLAEGTITNALLPSGAPRADAVTEDTTEYWAPTASDTLRATLAGAETADICFIAAHTLGSAGRTLSVQYFNGSTWQTIGTVAPADNAPFMVVFPSQLATGFGISVSGSCQIGVAWIGPRLIIPGGVVPDYAPVWAAHRVEKYPGVTRRGHFRGQRIERTGARLSAQMMPIDHDFALNDMADFRTHYNEGRAFVWASAPRLFTDDAAYCWAPDDASFAPTIRAGGDLVNLSLTMEAFVYVP